MFIEATVALGVSLIINIMVTSVFAHGLYDKTNNDIRSICRNSTESIHEFPANDEYVDADLSKAGIYLGCQFGAAALYIWSIGIFAAGQSSTMTGTYAGQFVMEGFLELHWARWKRVLLTRVIAICPTLVIAILYDIQNLTGMNDLLNALMSLMLPIALIPCLILSSSEKVMNEFKNGIITIITVSCLSIGIIGLNLYFVYDYVSNYLPQVWYVTHLEAAFFTYYILFVLYLTGCFLNILGFHRVTTIPKIGHWFEEPDVMEVFEEADEDDDVHGD